MRRYSPLAVLLTLMLVFAGCGKTVAPTTTVLKPISPKPGAVAPPAGEAPECSGKVKAEIEAGRGELGSCAPKKVQTP